MAEATLRRIVRRVEHMADQGTPPTGIYADVAALRERAAEEVGCWSLRPKRHCDPRLTWRLCHHRSITSRQLPCVISDKSVGVSSPAMARPLGELPTSFRVDLVATSVRHWSSLERVTEGGRRAP
jgi:hypothetical protein